MDMKINSLEERILAELGRQRKSVAWLARSIELSRPALIRRFDGEISFTLNELARIAGSLGVPTAELLSFYGTEQQAAA